mmetsp:Transcript_18251/g.38945  ORF Transcript_18251/g.38945 Transcript_18251/m.38945 type:complete len:366 (-) Transcript_18251:1-1098(-)
MGSSSTNSARRRRRPPTARRPSVAADAAVMPSATRAHRAAPSPSPAPSRLPTRLLAARGMPKTRRNWQTSSVVQTGMASRTAQVGEAASHSPPATKSDTSHPSHSAITIAAAGAPLAQISPHPRTACRLSRHAGQLAWPWRRRSHGERSASAPPCSSSPAVIASGAPTKPREAVSAKVSPTCARLPTRLTAIGKRTRRCAARNIEQSMVSTTPGSPARRSQTKRCASAASAAGVPAAVRSGSARKARGSERQSARAAWSARTRRRRWPTRAWLAAPHACARSGAAPKVEERMGMSIAKLQYIEARPAAPSSRAPSGRWPTATRSERRGAKEVRLVTVRGQASRSVAAASRPAIAAERKRAFCCRT